MAPVLTVPFNRATTAIKSYDYVRNVLDHGPLAGGGPYSKRCEALLASQIQAQAALLTSSCTDALEMSALLLNIAPGDEVIIPSFTFSSTATAFTLRGAVPVFADIRPDTMNIDETKIEHLITPKTKAIVVVHYAGVGCEMSFISSIASAHNIPILEDNAHGLYGTYRGQLLGTIGSLATQSFHETKNLSCGEGGAIVINDISYLSRAEILREKGTNRSRFFRGEVDKYTWVDNGSSYLPSEITAALLLAQLEEASSIQMKRRNLWQGLFDSIGPWADRRGIQMPHVPSYCEQAFHMFYLVMPSEKALVDLKRHLASRGVLAVTHYVPLHSSPYGVAVGRGECPISDDISARLLRLPFFTDMSREEFEVVVAAVTSG
jgi:dTDP-4-amino-4,6-dideoxygalactose transaminase